MGWDGGYNRVRLSPCPNCKRPEGGFMSSSAWDHDYSCCGDRCGKRLGHRIKYGFKPGMRLKNPCEHAFPPHPHPLRVQIKMLAHGVRQPSRFDGYHYRADGDRNWWAALRTPR